MNLVNDFNLLVALRALLEERNVTSAGARIGMGQPATSGALGRLRRHFEDDLLLRVGRHYELTPLARQLLPLVQETVELAERTMGLAGEFCPRTSSRTFTLAFSDCGFAALVDRLVRTIRDDAANVGLDVDVLPHGIGARELSTLSTRRDLIVAPVGYAYVGRTQRLMVDDIVCVTDRHNAVVDDSTVSLEALGKLPHAVASLDDTFLPGVYRTLAELDVEWSAPIRVANLLMLPAVVAGTDLVALVPRRVAALFADDDRLVSTPLSFAATTTHVMTWTAAHDGDAGHQWLRAMVRRAAVDATTAALPRLKCDSARLTQADRGTGVR